MRGNIRLLLIALSFILTLKLLYLQNSSKNKKSFNFFFKQAVLFEIKIF
jgi:hypothetical protein